MRSLKSFAVACGLLLVGAGSVSAQNCVPKDNEVALFKDWKFTGDCKILKAGGYLDIAQKAGFPNDQLSSIRVGSKMQAVLCEKPNFQGVCQTVTQDIEFLEGSQVGNDSVSSLKVFPK